MKKLMILLLGLSLMYCKGQDVNWEKLDSIQPDLILQKDKNPIPVLLLGTFHFNYPGLDGHKTIEAHKMDILSETKQNELKELLVVLERFEPTRIYIESFNQSYHDSLYTQYLQDAFILGRNEIYQIGYKLGKRLNHKKLYAVDASTLLGDLSKLSKDDITCLSALYDKEYTLVNETKDKFWHQTYANMYHQSDSLQQDQTLLETFLMMSKPALLKRMHGHYLSKGFTTVDNQGPDRLALWWYARNLRILNNILKTEPTENDRILVLFGNGHMSILNHLFESMPQYEVIPLKSLIKK